jgi:diguanylate cyclase (GGDEF)-like protein
MAKDQGRPERKSRAATTPPRALSTSRRLPPEPADEAAPAKPVRSQATRLAAEVDRLQQELLATRAQLAELAARADIDPLLDVFNRRGFERELARSLAYVKRYGTRAALIYLDLDGFKPINDRHGHAAGDAVLKAVTTALRRAVRASDIVARVGGDEFAVILWNLDERNALAKGRSLEQHIAAAQVKHGKHTLAPAASAGVAMLGPLDTCAEVMDRADRAMYARKSEHKLAARNAGTGR